jgi:hypothetical protein
MATLYVDFTNGNDSNDATSFANRVKTITSGITAARTAPGDFIRMMKTEDPVSLGISATWTNFSNIVTLGSSLTQDIDDGETSWSAATNVVTTTSGTRKRGATSASIAPAVAFGTGQMAYKPIALTNYSAYSKVSFWLRSSVALSSGALTLKLCSDTLGAVAINSFTINEALAAASWKCITADNGGALGVAINSISLDANSDFGATTILIDNIIACNNLTLTSVISKNSSASSLEWYPIQSISSTIVALDYSAASQANDVIRGYFGVTESVTTYKVEPIRITATQTVQEAGTVFFMSTYSGGWNTTDMTTQTGITIVDGGDSTATCFGFAQNNTLLENIITVRGTLGISIGSGLTNLYFNNCGAIGAAGGNGGITFGGKLTSIYCSNNNVGGIVPANSRGTFNGLTANNNFTNAIIFSNFGNFIFNNVSANNSPTLFLSNGGLNELVGVTSSSAATVFSASQGILKIKNFYYSTSSESSTILSSGGASIIYAHNINKLGNFAISIGGVGYIKLSAKNGSLTAIEIYDRSSTTACVYDGVTFHGSATGSYRHAPTTLHPSFSPFIQPTQLFPIAGSGTLSASIWCQRSASGVGGTFVLRGGQIAGIPNDVTASATTGNNIWEQLTLTAQPTQNGVVQLEFQSYQLTSAGNVFWSDASITQS